MKLFEKCPNCNTPVGGGQTFPETTPLAIHFTCAQCDYEEWITE